MFGKKVKRRVKLLVVLSLSAIFIIFFIFKSLQESVVYFLSPTEILNKTNLSLDKIIRVGGLVKEESIVKKDEEIVFIITDLKNEIIVTYKGQVPNLFSEGKGVVAEGKLKDKSFFIADKILAKHDENYMPPEVSKALGEYEK